MLFRFLRYILKFFSRIIYYIIPVEYKALKEVFSDQEYKFLAFTTNNHKAVIKILN